jgi:hypothetical protein
MDMIQRRCCEQVERTEIRSESDLIGRYDHVKAIDFMPTIAPGCSTK